MITTQKELRKQFRADHPDIDYTTIQSHNGKGRMYKTDTRLAFIVFLDYMNKDDQITDTLASRATFEPRQPKAEAWYQVQIMDDAGRKSILEHLNRQKWRRATAQKHADDIRKTWAQNMTVFLTIFEG